MGLTIFPKLEVVEIDVALDRLNGDLKKFLDFPIDEA